MGLELLAVSIDTTHLHHIVNDLMNACGIAVEILNDLLLYDKIEEGNLVLERKPVFVKPFLLQCLGIFSLQVCLQSEFYCFDFLKSLLSYRQASALGLNVELTFEENIPDTLKFVEIDIDSNKIAQVVRNLMSNALKFTPRGGSVKCFARYKKMSTCPDGSSIGKIRVEVRDSGIGINLVMK